MLDLRIPAGSLRIWPKLNSKRESLQDRSLQQFGHIERIEESAWSSRYNKI